MSRKERDEHPDRGDCWLWIGIGPASKAVVQWQIGKRKSRDANAFALALSCRILGRVQITSDPLNSYKFAILGAFGDRVDYAQEGKVFQSSKVPAHEWPKYRVDPLVGVEREAIHGNPNLGTSTVCHAERFFLTVRQENKRYARKTLAYSKLWENHRAATSVHLFIYNFVRKHEALKTTPAVALGITNHRWTLEEVAEMTDRYLRAQQDAEFESAFETFGLKPKAARVYPRGTPKTPWYLDPESGGPNPIYRKPGIQYES
jgi:IS1 family transposase